MPYLIFRCKRGEVKFFSGDACTLERPKEKKEEILGEKEYKSEFPQAERSEPEVTFVGTSSSRKAKKKPHKPKNKTYRRPTPKGERKRNHNSWKKNL